MAWAPFPSQGDAPISCDSVAQRISGIVGVPIEEAYSWAVLATCKYTNDNSGAQGAQTMCLWIPGSCPSICQDFAASRLLDPLDLGSRESVKQSGVHGPRRATHDPDHRRCSLLPSSYEPVV